MPKRPRQSHIPSQVTRRRKPRRPFLGSAAADGAEIEEVGEDEVPTFADDPTAMQGMPAYMGARPPVDTTPQRGGRRMELLRQTRETSAVRVIPGQLPTYERAFLTDELRRIGITAGGLLLFIIFLYVVLR